MGNMLSSPRLLLLSIPRKIMNRVKLLRLCNSEAVTARCLALQKLSVLSEAALRRLFLKRNITEHFACPAKSAFNWPHTFFLFPWQGGLQVTKTVIYKSRAGFLFLFDKSNEPELNHNSYCSVLMYK